MAARKELKRKELKVSILATSAKILRQTFPVIVYGFPKKELKNREIRLFLADLAYMNSKYLPGIKFMGARQIKSAPIRQ